MCPVSLARNSLSNLALTPLRITTIISWTCQTFFDVRWGLLAWQEINIDPTLDHCCTPGMAPHFLGKYNITPPYISMSFNQCPNLQKTLKTCLRIPCTNYHLVFDVTSNPQIGVNMQQMQTIYIYIYVTVYTSVQLQRKWSFKYRTQGWAASGWNRNSTYGF